MKLFERDMKLVLAGLRLVSLDANNSSDDKRRAKELEDRLGAEYTAGCELSKVPKAGVSEAN